jgi:hypothetical protein
MQLKSKSDITITVGDYEVVASGQVMQFEDNPIKITLRDEIVS